MVEGDGAAVERFDCATCGVLAGSACRTAGGDTAYRYHTARFMLVAELRGRPEVLVPEGREPGLPWRDGAGERPAAGRIGYAGPDYGSGEQDGWVAALEEAGCRRILVERAAGSVSGRPVRAQAVRAVAEAARAVGEAGRAGAAVLVVAGIGALARNSVELMAVAGELRAAGAGLEVLAGALAGEHRAGAAFFEVLEAAAGLDREDGRRSIVAGQRAAAERGRRSGRPRVFDDELVAEARGLRDAGVPVPEIAARLVISNGRNAGGHPSVASVYRALADAGIGADAPATTPETASGTTPATTPDAGLDAAPEAVEQAARRTASGVPAVGAVRWRSEVEAVTWRW